MAPIRVIQWTTGNIGKRSLHALITRPEYDLVGVYAHSPDKVGVDAAELAGLDEPTGVLATDDVDALLALRPDACVYNPLWSATDELCRLLAAGVNVCTTAGWITGGKLSAEERARVEAAAATGNASIFGSGAHPGFTNMISLVCTQMCERVDQISVTESADASGYASAPTMRAMGFSLPPDTPGLEESVRRESEVFAESVAMTADVLGAVLDRITFDATFTTAHGDSDLGFMQIPAGTIAAVQGYHRGWVGERNVVSVGFQWIMGTQVEPRFTLAHGHVITDHRTPGPAHRHAGAAPEGLVRGRLYGRRRDLHCDAGGQRDRRGGGGTARHRQLPRSALDHRQVRPLTPASSGSVSRSSGAAILRHSAQIAPLISGDHRSSPITC